MHELTDKIIAHAYENYEAGWDIIVECVEPKEVSDVLEKGEVTTFPDAVRLVAKEFALSARVDRANDCRPGESDDEIQRFNLGL